MDCDPWESGQAGEAACYLIGVCVWPLCHGQQGTMTTYSPGKGPQLAGLSLPTSYLKVPLDSVDIQNEGDLRHSISTISPSPLVMLGMALRKRLTPL